MKKGVGTNLYNKVTGCLFVCTEGSRKPIGFSLTEKSQKNQHFKIFYLETWTQHIWNEKTKHLKCH